MYQLGMHLFCAELRKNLAEEFAICVEFRKFGEFWCDQSRVIIRTTLMKGHHPVAFFATNFSLSFFNVISSKFEYLLINLRVLNCLLLFHMQEPSRWIFYDKLLNLIYE